MLEITRHDSVGAIRLAKAPVNALNHEMVSALTRSLHEIGKTHDAVIISGNEGVFSAGLDVVELLPLGRQAMTDFWTAFFELLKTIVCLPVPVATAITGHAPAGGAILNLMSDYRVMSRGNFKIGLNEARVGLVVCPLLQESLERVIGKRLAEKMLMTGTLLSPEQALETGLVDALEDGFDNTVEHALNWCKELLSLPRHAMLGNRAMARAQFCQAFTDSMAENVAKMVDGWFTEDTQVSLAALVNKLKSRS